MAKKKMTPFGVFIRVFCRTIAVMLVMLAVGFTSYAVTLHYYRSHDVSVDENVKELVLDIVSDAKVTDLAKNLICVTSGNRIEHMVLEIFNTNTLYMDYLTLPVDEEITLSNDLYQRLYAANAEIPQVFKLSNLHKYFEDSTVYEYAEVIVGELLSTEISFYTVMTKNQFQEVFSLKKGFADGTTTKTAVYKKKFWKICAGLKDEDSVSEYIEAMYDHGLLSNLSVKNRQKYAKNYAKLTKKNIHFYPSYLTAGDTVMFDAQTTGQALADILKNSLSYYTQWQQKEKMANAVSSVGKRIYVANGARVTGLAASYQEILVNAGYTVTGIGNYDGDVLEDTRILVREEGMGYDLLSYFNNASIETGELPEGIDIEIIVGAGDAG